MALQVAEALSSSGAARIVGVSSQTVRGWIKAGVLPAQETPLGFIISRADAERIAREREARLSRSTENP